MSEWLFLSKNKQDQYINMLASSVGSDTVDTNDFDYESSCAPLVLRGILKHKIMHRCWQDGRDFYYVDTGYFGNRPGTHNPQGWKKWHRIVHNDLQHNEIVPRPGDRWQRLALTLPQRRRRGSRVILALPDEKPCKFYGLDHDTWTQQTLQQIQQHTDREVVIRARARQRSQRVFDDPLEVLLTQDVHCLVTFNSVAAIESIMMGVPAFVLAPTHAAAPVANRDLTKIDDPYWPDQDKLHAWACHLAYGQFHVDELASGHAMRFLKGSK